MIKLNSRQLHVVTETEAHPLVARVTCNLQLPRSMRSSELLLLDTWTPGVDVSGFRGLLLRHLPSATEGMPRNAIVLPPSLAYLGEGDVVRLSAGDHSLSVLYRSRSAFNALLVTERCNHMCLMCSQPPKTANDGYLADELLAAIPLFAAESREVCLTGGEPTLLGPRFMELVRSMRNYLPRTSLHVLSNGRSFADARLAQELAAIRHPDLMMGIPLYGATSELHEYIVQSPRAFDETIRGILNLKRAGVRVEVRVVIQQANYKHLPELAEFIVRNLLFVDQVALMGLEPIGYAKANLPTIWIDPADYQPQLASAIRTLAASRVPTSIYNHQLCTLDRSIWTYARRSISDWKNEYLEECEACAVKHQCGGFFSSGIPIHSSHIRAIATV
jgi:His-Xaa-Ser system radical SAM maturase HxsC